MTTFKDYCLKKEILTSIEDLGYKEPSPIQKKAIPFILESNKDLIALAQTGTGKTAAFALPILNQINKKEKALQTIILCPTRELCIQLTQDIKKFTKHLKAIKVTAVYGGEKIGLQINALKRGSNVVVGTPGRVRDLIKRKVLKLNDIKWLVLDEADEMLDMGFKEDLDAILKETPKQKQTLLFSATISKNVRSIADQYMTDAKEIKIGASNIGAENVSHEYYIVSAKDRFDALKRIIDYLPQIYGILFCRTRRETQEVAEKLKRAGYDAECLHGEITQSMRTKIMGSFKKKQIRLLVATDVAARGIDVNDLSHVINYNLPDQNETYTHRSGRTGRAGNFGVSINIVSPREKRKIKSLESIIGKEFKFKKVPDVKEVIEKQVEVFVTSIENKGSQLKEQGLFKEAIERLGKIKKEDLIKGMLQQKFPHFLDFKKERDLNASVKILKRRIKIDATEELKINLGKKSGFDVKKLFSLLNSNNNLKGIEVGKIILRAEHTYFSVEKDKVEKVIKNLSGKVYRKRKLLVLRNKEKFSKFSKKRKSRKKKRFR